MTKTYAIVDTGKAPSRFIAMPHTMVEGLKVVTWYDQFKDAVKDAEKRNK